MAVTLFLTKRPDAFIATDHAMIEAMNGIKNGETVKAVITVPRNLQHHKLLFALLNLVWKSQPEPQMFPTVESLLDTLKMATGHVKEVRTVTQTHDGKFSWSVILVPDSISFAAMDQVSFREWFDSAVRIILERVLPNCNKADLEQQVYDMLREPGPDVFER